MKRRTYNNVMKAIKIIQTKGYDFDESYGIVMKCFDNLEMNNNGMPLEWYLDKIVDKDVYISETSCH